MIPYRIVTGLIGSIRLLIVRMEGTLFTIGFPGFPAPLQGGFFIILFFSVRVRFMGLVFCYPDNRSG